MTSVSSNVWSFALTQLADGQQRQKKTPLSNQCCAADVASVKSLKKIAREGDVSVRVCLLFLFHFSGDTPEGWGFDMEQGRAFSLPFCLRRVCAAGPQC